MPPARQTDRPTDIEADPPQSQSQEPEPPVLPQNLDDYISLRITIEHSKVYDLIHTVLNDVNHYIVYPHRGKAGDNQHFHICIAGVKVESRCVDKFRIRLKRFVKGAGKLMAKAMHNGVCSFVGYVKHEDAKPYIKGFDLDWFNDIPATKWEEVEKKDGKPVKVRNPDHFKQITYMNMERVCLRYRAENGIESKELGVTLEHMHKHGWRLQVTVLRQGIPQTFFEQFTAACKGESIWCEGRFNRMMKYENWREHNDRY